MLAVILFPSSFAILYNLAIRHFLLPEYFGTITKLYNFIIYFLFQIIVIGKSDTTDSSSFILSMNLNRSVLHCFPLPKGPGLSSQLNCIHIQLAASIPNFFLTSCPINKSDFLICTFPKLLICLLWKAVSCLPSSLAMVLTDIQAVSCTS